MKMQKLSWAFFIMIGLLSSFTISAQENRNVSQYNLAASKIGLKGYDPVSYWAEGGSLPQKGQSDITLNHRGVTYQFASTQNLETFKTMPERYEPAHGGWCSWAMFKNARVDIGPTYYTIDGSRIFFFAHPRAKRNFDRNIARHSQGADTNWMRMSGEGPRL